jgi:hypothetical protein
MTVSVGEIPILPHTAYRYLNPLMFLGLTLVSIGGTALLLMKKKRAGDNKS